MPTNSPAKSPPEQLLGEIETRIVGMQYYENSTDVYTKRR